MDSRRNQTKERVDDEVIEELSCELGRDGVPLGRALKLSPAKIKIIQSDNIGNQEEINHNIIQRWKQEKGSEATLPVLGDALEKIGRKDLAEKFCEGYGKAEDKKWGQKRKRKVPESQEEIGPSKKQKKNTGPKAVAPAKRVTQPKTEQKKRKLGTISLKIVSQEQNGYPQPHPTTGVWFRGRWKAAANSKYYFIIVWGNQAKGKISLFKIGACVTLKAYRMDGNKIQVGEKTVVEKCETAIRIDQDLQHKLKKEEKKKLQTLEDVKKRGQSSLTKLRVCEVGEYKEKKRNEDGKKIPLRILKVRNKKSKQKYEIVQYGTDAKRKLLKKGRTVILNVWYNEERKQFETKGPFKMKICPKSKKKKSKKKKSK